MYTGNSRTSLWRRRAEAKQLADHVDHGAAAYHQLLHQGATACTGCTARTASLSSSDDSYEDVEANDELIEDTNEVDIFLDWITLQLYDRF